MHRSAAQDPMSLHVSTRATVNTYVYAKLKIRLLLLRIMRVVRRICGLQQYSLVLTNSVCYLSGKLTVYILGNVTAVTTVAPTTSTSTHQPEVAYFCLNDGVYDPSMQFCHCLSGFSGRSCERFDRKTKNWIF